MERFYPPQTRNHHALTLRLQGINVGCESDSAAFLSFKRPKNKEQLQVDLGNSVHFLFLMPYVALTLYSYR